MTARFLFCNTLDSGGRCADLLGLSAAFSTLYRKTVPVLIHRVRVKKCVATDA